MLQLDTDHSTHAHELAEELENMKEKAEREKADLVNEVAMIQKERDDLLLLAENEKQEELRLVANEKSLLSERNNKLSDEIIEVKGELEKLKRDAVNKATQDKVSQGSK